MFTDTSERIEYITRKYNDSHALADALEERVEDLQSTLLCLGGYSLRVLRSEHDILAKKKKLRSTINCGACLPVR